MSATEVTGLEREFNSALRDYHAIRQQMKADIARRLLSRSKYAGTNISINGDTSQTFYVTQQGVAKWYPDSGVLSGTAGSNGCPAADKSTSINIPWSDLYTSENYVLPTSPSMTTGSAMQSGQACGREGRNVYVSSLLPSGTHISTKYVGCYNGSDMSNGDTGESTGGGTMAGMTQAPFTSIVSPSICNTYAAENGYKYAGIGNYADGKMNCYVGNDLDAATQYGSATSIYTPVQTWSSSTALTSTSSAMRQMQVTNGGQVIVIDTDGKTLFKSGEAVSECGSSGGGKIKVTSATYGGNCSDSSVEIGNVTSKVSTGFKCDGATSCNIPVSNSTLGGDPAKGCRKDFDIVYQCGGSQFTKNLSPAEGKTMVLDCKSYAEKNCVFTLIVRDNGTAALYKGSKKAVSAGTAGSALWTVGTAIASAADRVKNPAWESSKGKYGRNYMISGESLSAGEWIGSPGGCAQLIMKSDGNLVLHTASVKSNCKTMADGSVVGGNGAFALYEIPDGAGGEPALVGKVAYVDKNSVAHVYPSSMLGYTNDYVRTKGYNSVGNDIDSRIADTEETCKKMCDAESNCAGYVYDVPKQTCYVKNNGMYPNGSRAYTGTDDFIMGVRKPKIVRGGGDGGEGGSGAKLTENGMCTSFISEELDSSTFSKYIQGSEMTADYKCGEVTISAEQKDKYEAAVARLEEVGQKLVKKISEYNGSMSAARRAMMNNTRQFEKSAVEYQDILDKLRAQREEDGRQEVEGVEGFCGGGSDGANFGMTQTTLDRMLQVSNLKVSSADLQFWILSFLGLSALAFIVLKAAKR